MPAWSIFLAVFGLSSLTGLAADSPLSSGTKPIAVSDGSVIQVEAGELTVLESRRRPTARQVTIPYYRLKSSAATPASPIFLLAGGPGSSGLDLFSAEETHREAMFYRTIADVVMFDQRGGGHSRPAMHCPQTRQYPLDQPVDERRFQALAREALMACRDEHLRQGVDLAAYNTVENAADVNDLRIALGYQKITLIGGSYGSHLALQVMRQYPDTIDRVVIFGVEGPDHTWDSPSEILNTLERIADATEHSAAFVGRVPEGGLLKTIRGRSPREVPHLVPQQRVHHAHPAPEVPHRELAQLVRLQEARPALGVPDRARRQRDHPGPLVVVLAGDLRDGGPVPAHGQHQTGPVLGVGPVLVGHVRPPDVARVRMRRPGPVPALGAPGRPQPAPTGPMAAAPAVDERGDQREQHHRREREPPGRVHNDDVTGACPSLRALCNLRAPRVQPNR